MASLGKLAIASIFAIGYLGALMIYRLVLSPIAKFPGPRLAAVSNWYEFYYDVIRKGHFTAHIQQLHKKYGPIVRITPTEVHISDPEYFDTLYSRGNGRRDKYAYFSGSFGFTSDSFNTVDHNLHRLRRKAIAPFFSAARISDFQPVIHAKVDKLCDILHTYVGNDVVVSLDRAWIALTTDIITEYSFAKSFDNLDSPGFKDTMHEALIAVYTITKFAMQFPFVIPILDALPQWLIRMVKPEIMPVVGLKRDLAAEIRNIRNDVNQGHKTAIHPTIFHEVLLNDDLPAEEKTDARLGDEAQLIVAAGLVTTSWALTIASFYLSRDPHITLQLREELSSSNLSTPYDWNQLQKLPYLNGVVHEAIRLSHGTATRHPRLAPDAELVYGRWKIPRNTPVSMTTMDIMMNETVFPEPGNFLPERWVRDGTALEKYFVPFGKGSRQCLGINLAQAELYIAIASVVSKFDFELYETDESDVIAKHAYLVPYPKWNSKGVRARVRRASA